MPVLIDPLDLTQLERENVITYQQVGNLVYRVKLTQQGINAAVEAIRPLPQSSRGRGFAPDVQDHQRVVQAAMDCGDTWSAKLSDVCKRLAAREAKFPDSFSGTASSWEHLAPKIGDRAVREKLLEYIRYRLSYIQKSRPPKAP